MKATYLSSWYTEINVTMIHITILDVIQRLFFRITIQYPIDISFVVTCIKNFDNKSQRLHSVRTVTF